MSTSAWIAVAVFLCAGVANAQTGKVIELRTANKMERSVINGEEVRDFVGNVHFVQPSDSGGTVKLWCDRALQFIRSGRIDCFGNVKLVRENVTIYAKEGQYFDKTRKAVLKKGVRLERPGTVLTALDGDYDVDAKKAHFVGNVVVVDSVSTTTCDVLTYFDGDERSIAVGRVTVTSPRDAVTVFGDSLVHFGSIDYTIIPSNPKLVQVDTSALGRLDTLVVVSRTMEAYRDASQPHYVASDSVRIVRNELAAVSGRGFYRPGEGLLILTRQPVVWYDRNQVSGDSIAVRLENGRLRSVFVAGRAMAVSQSDSLLTGRFDQLTGRTLTLYFGEENIERIVAERQSISLYYLFENAVPNGANKSSGDKIVVEFMDGLVRHISVAGGVEGQYIPEPLMVGRERFYDLDGFQWYTKKPRRMNTQIILDK